MHTHCARGPGNRALRKARASIPRHVYSVTTATHNRRRFFDDFHAAWTASRCFDNEHLLGETRMLAWVLMPDHVHWLIQLGERRSLAGDARRLKSASALAVNRILHREGALWAPAFYDHMLRADEDLRRAARYIVANPVRAGLVAQVGDYPFWNAVWL